MDVSSPIFIYGVVNTAVGCLHSCDCNKRILVSVQRCESLHVLSIQGRSNHFADWKSFSIGYRAELYTRLETRRMKDLTEAKRRIVELGSSDEENITDNKLQVCKCDSQKYRCQYSLQSRRLVSFAVGHSEIEK